MCQSRRSRPNTRLVNRPRLQNLESVHKNAPSGGAKRAPTLLSPPPPGPPRPPFHHHARGLACAHHRLELQRKCAAEARPIVRKQPHTHRERLGLGPSLHARSCAHPTRPHVPRHPPHPWPTARSVRTCIPAHAATHTNQTDPNYSHLLFADPRVPLLSLSRSHHGAVHPAPPPRPMAPLRGRRLWRPPLDLARPIRRRPEALPRPGRDADRLWLGPDGRRSAQGDGRHRQHALQRLEVGAAAAVAAARRADRLLRPVPVGLLPGLQ